MKTHIGPIYLILGLMAVSVLTIGAAKSTGKSGEQLRKPVATAQSMLPSPLSFRIELAHNGEKSGRSRVLVIGSPQLDAQMQAQIDKALAEARARKSG
jgi:hypothetical protein